MRGWFHVVTDYYRLRPPLKSLGQVVLVLSHRERLLLLFGTYMLMLLVAEGIDYCLFDIEAMLHFLLLLPNLIAFADIP
jgi:hypothetical protein